MRQFGPGSRVLLVPALCGLLWGCSGDDDGGSDGNGGSGNGGSGNGGSGNGGSSGQGSGTGGSNGGSSAGGSSSGGSSGSGAGGTAGSGGATPLPEASCDALDDGSTDVAEPELTLELYDSFHEAWSSSPGVADLDDDGNQEIVVGRDDRLVIWNADGSVKDTFDVEGRIWSSPVIADLRPEIDGLEVAVASRGSIYAWDADGAELSGFPHAWQDEMRSLAAADIDGDGRLELVAATTNRLEANSQIDILIAVNDDGTTVDNFPPNTTGNSGCDDWCFVHSAYDQNVALGDVNGDGVADILAPQDNAYVSLHEGNGLAFDAAPIFDDRSKFPGIRFMLDYQLAQQGYADDEETQNQGHFTNTAPSIADMDGDGDNEIILLGSVQNAAQSDRERGVAVWVVEHDGTRPDAWVTPFHAPDFIDGLWDPGDNIVATTNQATVVDLDPSREGYELVFSGFDGRIHAIDSQAEELWQWSFTTETEVYTGGVVAADLSRDGRPEIIFNTYSTRQDVSVLYILGANGEPLHQIDLPGRGAMPVPSVADIDGDGQLEILVSLKDAVDGEHQVLVYSVPDSATNCLPWPTGRGNLWRNGTVE